MPTYNFKRETKLHIVYNGLRYFLDIYPDFSATQTFDETTVQVKTLHSQYNMFDGAVINKANPANFSFTIPVIHQNDMDIVFTLLTAWDTNSKEALLNTCDLYIESSSEVYKIEKAVFENGVFQFVKDSVVLLNIQGTASKLSKYTLALPGVLQTKSTPTFIVPTYFRVEIGGVVQPYITAATVELKNDVRWTEFDNLHASLNISNASGTQFPGAFVVSGRVLSGTVEQYITETTNSVNTWDTNSSFNLKVGNLAGPVKLEINMPNIVFTNRLGIEDIYKRSFDFRMTTNPANLSTVIIKS